MEIDHKLDSALLQRANSIPMSLTIQQKGLQQFQKTISPLETLPLESHKAFQGSLHRVQDNYSSVVHRENSSSRQLNICPQFVTVQFKVENPFALRFFSVETVSTKLPPSLFLSAKEESKHMMFGTFWLLDCIQLTDPSFLTATSTKRKQSTINMYILITMKGSNVLTKHKPLAKRIPTTLDGPFKPLTHRFDPYCIK
ncbi:hypothetical protein H5410_023106 [Solanum commersonii]|uniref:Uncharacterized protein n=1 Tax=Solanum commersonii TaxID=4109 RepID=A0A9J5ZFX3_SOLCO|nr:hypothetical protein H5410_023106 [Solanum commersonii]